MFSDYSEFGPSLLGDDTRKLCANFRLIHANVTMANTIRRAILSLTPSVGFRTEPHDTSDVEIKDTDEKKANTTPLVNEMIAHRVGMIPVCVRDIANFKADQYECIIDKTNDTEHMMDVRAGDFKVFMKHPENPLEPPIQLPTKDYFPPDPITGDTILITRLRPQWNPAAPKERIFLKARPSISTGAENSRWSPVSQCSYEYTRDNDPDRMKVIFDNWLLSIKKISDPSTLSEEKRSTLDREFRTMEIQRCYLKNEKGEAYDFTFHIESVGVQPVTDIVKAGLAACEALVTKYQNMDSAIPPNVRLQQGDSRFPSIDVIFQNECHTLGNLLETYIVENNIDGDAEPKVSYVGYKVPHPLRPEMFVRIGVESIEDVATQMRTAQLVVASACRALSQQFRALQAAWESGEALKPAPAPSSAPVDVEPMIEMSELQEIPGLA